MVPDASGQVSIVGSTGVTTVGGTNSLTISLTGGGVAIDSFLPDSGTSPVVPDGAGQVSLLGDGSITTVGGTNALTTQLTGMTDHNLLIGAGTTTLTKLPPSATVGAPLISAGAGADPKFSTTTTIVDANGTLFVEASFDMGGPQIGLTNSSAVLGATAAMNIVTDAQGTLSDVYTLYRAGSGSGRQWVNGVQGTAADYLIQYAPTGTQPYMDGTTFLKIDAVGIQTLPAQPSFFAYLTVGDSNVTGNGANYTLGSGNALTVLQQGSAMGTTGTFTVPADGWYHLSYNIQAQGITAAMNDAIVWIRVNGTDFYSGTRYVTAAASNPFTSYSFLGSTVVKLTSGDLVIVQLTISNGAGDDVDILAGALTTANASYFSGIKVA